MDNIAAIGRKRKVNSIWEEMKSEEEATLKRMMNLTQSAIGDSDAPKLKVSNVKKRKIAEVGWFAEPA